MNSKNSLRWLAAALPLSITSGTGPWSDDNRWRFWQNRYQRGTVMSEITLSIPDETLLALKVNPDQLGAELRLAAAVKLYELGRMSSGAAAKLAGVPRTVFLMRLADYGVDTIKLSEEELRQETRLV